MTMPFDLARFKRISDRHKLAVFGYIHTVQKLFPCGDSYYHIHDLIKQTCTLFYASIHEWDTEFMGPNVQFIEKTNSIKHTKPSQSSSSFLKDKFISGVHHWRFRIDKCKVVTNWTTTIGIWKTKSDIIDKWYPFCAAFTDNYHHEWYAGYGYEYNVGCLTYDGNGEREYGVKVEEGDIVEMYCDMNKLELRFSVNGTDYGVAFANIEDTEYRAAVNLLEVGDMITLLD